MLRRIKLETIKKADELKNCLTEALCMTEPFWKGVGGRRKGVQEEGEVGGGGGGGGVCATLRLYAKGGTQSSPPLVCSLKAAQTPPLLSPKWSSPSAPFLSTPIPFECPQPEVTANCKQVAFACIP